MMDTRLDGSEILHRGVAVGQAPKLSYSKMCLTVSDSQKDLSFFLRE